MTTYCPNICRNSLETKQLHLFAIGEDPSDPTDNFLLALCEAGNADYLVTGDKSGLLALDRHKATRIVSARDFAALVA